MPLSVLIPSHGRPERLGACLDGLAAQTVAPAEVRVILDGGTDEDADRLTKAHGHRLPRLHIHAVPHAGYMPAREALRRAATAPLSLSLNDDVCPHPRLLAEHAALHGGAGPTVGVGFSPWVVPNNPNRFDQILAQTGLVFFDPVAALARGETLNYRHAVGLNVSFPTALGERLGGFADFPHTYGYEDIEMAWKLVHHGGAALRFSEAARADHDHRYLPRDVMRREYNLGRAAWAMAGRSPAFAADLFGRDIRDPDELTYSRRFLTHQRSDAQRVEGPFTALDAEPFDPHATDAVLAREAAHWVVLKRYLWRWGLWDAAHAIAPRYAPLIETDPLP